MLPLLTTAIITAALCLVFFFTEIGGSPPGTITANEMVAALVMAFAFTILIFTADPQRLARTKGRLRALLGRSDRP